MLLPCVSPFRHRNGGGHPVDRFFGAKGQEDIASFDGANQIKSIAL